MSVSKESLIGTLDYIRDKAGNLSIDEILILLAVSDSKGMRLGDISEKSGATRHQVSRFVNLYSRHGYRGASLSPKLFLIKEDTGNGPGRPRLVSLTAQSKKIVAGIK
ncbi:MarR family transcriptional regulator [Pelagibaculum spongiae]|uniref:MarR family transcriptional regulator n=1 Tax=Pelagibaculum spongiae TaxID=2080658 RepID=A0A2V1H1X7_9GAMM|nr:helix-turn-helix domain-containing protein [Pelagibaculum spongiae]PVZ70442.1 hypothetical protein DC094_07595 [Pelagibaculum spongiae]